VNITVFILKEWNADCVKRTSETYSPVWVSPSGHCNCVLGVDSNSFSILHHRRHTCSTVNRTNSTKYLYTEWSASQQMDSYSKFKVVTVVLLRIQVLWDVTCVNGSVNPDISMFVVPSSSGSSSSLTAWSSSWYAVTLTWRHYNSFETLEPTHLMTEQHISENLNHD
jgi:hypothetical protein